MQRRGSVMPLILLVLFVLTVAVGAVQYLFVQSTRATRMGLDYDDTLARADGIVAMLMSRWKGQISWSLTDPVPDPASGSESGTWDSRRWVAGWKRERLEATEPIFRILLWVRFPDSKPRRSWRYELAMRLPTMMEPRVARIVGFEVDDVDPADEAQRAEAFERLRGTREVNADNAAFVEARYLQIEPLASGRRPVAEVTRLGPASEGSLSQMMLAYKEYLETAHEKRFEAAKKMMGLASGSPRWFDLARVLFAGALIQRGETSPTEAKKKLWAEAADLLRTVLDRAACCSPGRVALRLASLIARNRDNLESADELVAARARGRQELEKVARKGTNFHHDGADVTEDEPPKLFERTWRFRAAQGFSKLLNKGNPHSGGVLMTATEDGADMVLLAQGRWSFDPQAWHPDGSQLFATTGKDAEKTRVMWRIPLDGTRPGIALPPALATREPIPGPDFKDPMKFSPDGATWCFGTHPDYAVLGRGSKRLAHFRAWDGKVQSSATLFSPDGKWLCVPVTTPPRRASYRLIPVELALTDGVACLTDLDTGQKGSAGGYPRPFVELPSLPDDATAQCPDWKRIGNEEWFAVTIVNSEGYRPVFFPITHDPDPVAGALIRSAAPAEAPYGMNLVWPRAMLLADPPGLVLDHEGTRRFPLPVGGTAGPPVPIMPQPAGSLVVMDRISAKPSGRACLSYRQSTEAAEPDKIVWVDLKTGASEAFPFDAQFLGLTRHVGSVLLSPLPGGR